MRRATIIAAVVPLLVMAATPASAGPFMPVESTAEFRDAAEADTMASADSAMTIVQTAVVQTMLALNEVQALEFPADNFVTVFNTAGEEGASIVTNTGHTSTTAIGSGGAQAHVTLAYGDFLAKVFQQKIGLDTTGGNPPVSFEGATHCVSDAVTALAAALPGEDIILCAGSYEGPLVIDTPFVTVRGLQGAGATLIENDNGPGVVVMASGVTLQGLSIRADTAGIVIGGAGDGLDSEVWGTVVRDVKIQGAATGVHVRDAVSTLLWHNTVRLTRTAVLVDAASGSSDFSDVPGVVVAANNLVDNQRFAVRQVGDALPVLAISNHYGPELMPVLETAPGQCTDAGAPARCDNAVGYGVVPVGWSPVPL